MTSAKNIINFQFTIYMCISLFLRLVGENRPWRNRWMTRWMWSIISSICPVIAGLWHVCHLFLLLSPPCRVCIPLFLRLVGVNRPWWDGWMTEWMDHDTDGWNDASRRRLLCVMFFHTLFRVHTHTYIYIYLFTSVFFASSSFLFFQFFLFFPFFDHFFLECTLLKKKSQFLQKKFVATVWKFTKKNHCSVQNFFCFSTPDLFALNCFIRLNINWALAWALFGPLNDAKL